MTQRAQFQPLKFGTTCSAHTSGRQMLTAHTFSGAKNEGIVFRWPTPGEETDFVLAYVQSQLPQPKGDLRLTVFIEPKVGSSFPDVVAAYWDASVAESWPEQRRQLSMQALKILHFSYCTGKVDLLKLQEHFKHSLRKSIDELIEARLIKPQGTSYRLANLSEAIALRRLIAIEAKLGDYKRGLDQAVQNTWFASDSYLLVHGQPRDPSLHELANRTGVRIVTGADKVDAAPKKPGLERIPRSYFSWQFNEWAWKFGENRNADLSVSSRMAATAVS